MTDYFLCHDNAIGELQTRGFTIQTEQGELELFLVRQDNKVHAYRNHCPHLGIPLNWQPDQFLCVEDRYIQCATHGALFTMQDGHCIAGPCTGQNLTTLPLEYRNDEIWLILTNEVTI